MDSKIWEIKQAEKICCFDIDGVLLSSYPQCWIDYANRKMKTNFTDLNEMKAAVSYDAYRKLKEQYRTSGIKETFPADSEAATITKALKKLGYTIIIMTARPAHEYPNLYTQTINWLKKNNIVYDCIIFEEKNKHAKIISEFYNIKFMVEDNSYIANQISKWGYKVYLVKNKYNKGLKLLKKVVPIDSLKEILENE